MPSKGKRTAARQAQLSQRKRRTDRRPQAAQSVQDQVAEPSEAADGPPAGVAVEGARPSVAPPPVQSLRAPQLQQIRPYVTRELRRIGILTGFIVVILAALTILLR